MQVLLFLLKRKISKLFLVFADRNRTPSLTVIRRWLS